MAIAALMLLAGGAHAQAPETGAAGEGSPAEPVPAAAAEAAGAVDAAKAEAEAAKAKAEAEAAKEKAEAEAAKEKAEAEAAKAKAEADAVPAEAQTAADAPAETETDEEIEEIVVTGRATGIAPQNQANSVSRVTAEQIKDVPAPTLSEVLQGRIAGANIQSNSGAPGGGIQMQLRGVSSIKGRSAPLYVVDGVIISDVAIPNGISAVTASVAGSSADNVQDNQVNRIADLNPDDIASIQVLKGASAAAIYGAKASNGVVIITTKQGEEGPLAINLRQRFGMWFPGNTLGARTYETREEAVDKFGDLGGEIWDRDGGQRFDHEAELASQRGLSYETAVSVSGGSEDTGYYTSLLLKEDVGIIPGTGYEKQSFRVRLDHEFGDLLELTAWVNPIHSVTRRGVTNNDNAAVSHYIVLSGTPSFIDLSQRADGTWPVNPFVSSGANPLQTAALMDDTEDVWRVIGALTGELEFYEDDTHELDLVTTLGVDSFTQESDLFFPPALHFESADGAPGTALDTNSDALSLNVDTNLVYEFTGEALDATTSAGFQYEERSVETVYIVSRNLNAGLSNVDAGTQVGLREVRSLVRDQGFYLQQQLLMLDDTLTVIGGVRAEQSSVNGDPDQLFWYPKAAAAWRAPFDLGPISLLKLRAAYGETGNQPLYGQKFTALDATVNIEGAPGIVASGVIGDPTIEPERQREIEVGFDLAMDRSLNLELTLYQRNITNLLLERSTAPSTGAEKQFFNGGELVNRGLELLLYVEPVATETFTWDLTLTFAMNRSEILDLPVPAFNTAGFGTSVGAFRIEEGASATQIYGNIGDEVGEVGDTEPDFRAGIHTSFSFAGFRLSTLLDWQQGGSVINLTRFLYDINGNAADAETGGVERSRQFGEENMTGVYVEDASFLKVREVSLRYDLPRAALETLDPMTQAYISISGRDLLTITDYSGLDPEVSNFGNRPIGRNIDVAPFPPARSVWLTIGASL